MQLVLGKELEKCRRLHIKMLVEKDFDLWGYSMTRNEVVDFRCVL